MHQLMRLHCEYVNGHTYNEFVLPEWDLRVQRYSEKRAIPFYPISVSCIPEKPEIIAAIGASLSRDPSPLAERVENILQKPVIADRIMSRYFRNYGHNSIGDMGTLSLSVEGLSMLGAVETISFPLFNGQEASTRYISWNGKLSSHTLLSRPLRKEKLARRNIVLLFKLYNKIREYLLQYYQQAEGMENKEALPRALDVAGAFIPVAAKTNVFLHVTIRALIEQARKMITSPLDEVRYIGELLLAVGDAQCPNSVRPLTEDEVVEQKLRHQILQRRVKMRSKHSVLTHTCDVERIRKLSSTWFADRDYVDQNTLPGLGTITVHDTIDFRSMRDIWRHRVFTKQYCFHHQLGMEEWYLDELPRELRASVGDDLATIFTNAETLLESGVGEKDLAYILPMGVKARVVMEGRLSDWLYFLHLRSGTKVHPTVRHFVFRNAKEIARKIGFPAYYLLSSEEEKTNYSMRSKDA